MAGYTLLDHQPHKDKALKRVRKSLESTIPALKKIYLANEMTVYAESLQVASIIVKNLKSIQLILIDATNSESSTTLELHCNVTVYVEEEVSQILKQLSEIPRASV